MLFLAWGFGLNLALGRFVTPREGAIDNGAACVPSCLIWPAAWPNVKYHYTVAK